MCQRPTALMFTAYGKGEPNPYYAKTSYLTLGKAKQA
jgi:hypothetical protein